MSSNTPTAARSSLAVAAAPRDGIATTTFRAMGTDVHVLVVDGPPTALDLARGLIADLEDRWSRFRPDSEISHLNASDGVATPVSDDTMLLLQLSLTGWELSDGRFDPTVHDAVVGHGYDRTFTALAAPEPPAVPDFTAGQEESSLRPEASGPTSGLADLDVDAAAGTVRLPAGVRVDPGGIGKGLAADLAVRALLDAGAAGALANLGGDLRVAGAAPEPAGWIVTVDAPSGRPLADLALRAGGVATSTPAHRRWQHAGAVHHHLIDPATGRPADAPARSATVVAGEGWLAEVLAKVLVLDADPAPLAAVGATGLTLGTDGVTRHLPRLERFLA